MASVWRPGGVLVSRLASRTRAAVRVGEPGQADLASTGHVDGIQDIYLEVAGPVTLEHNVGTIRRPFGRPILGGVARQPKRVRAVCVHDVNLIVPIPIAHERNPATIPRPCGPSVVSRIGREVCTI